MEGPGLRSNILFARLNSAEFKGHVGKKRREVELGQPVARGGCRNKRRGAGGGGPEGREEARAQIFLLLARATKLYLYELHWSRVV